MARGERLCGWGVGLCLAVLVLAFAGGCRTLPPLPSEGGPTWRELTSQHFVLYTDLGPREAHELSLELERLLVAYLQLGWKAKGEIPLKLNVVVFANPSDFHEFAGEGLLGYYLSEALLEPWVVTGYANDHYPLDTLKHELNHSIAYQAIQNQPRWFAEGIATYFETAFLSREGRFVVGMPAKARVEYLRHLGVLPPAILLRPRVYGRGPLYEQWFYSTSWLLVHYLMTERSEAFGQFQERLARGEDSDAAWSAAFPDLGEERLLDALKAYFARGEFVTYTMPIAIVIGEPRERLMTDADVYVLRSVLHANCQGCGNAGEPKAREELALALRADPRHVRAGVVRVLDEPTGAARLIAAREFVATHADSWLAWLALALTEFDSGRAGSDEGRAAAARVIELAPRQPYGLMLFALHAAKNGRGDEAVALSKRALRLQPTNPKLLALAYRVLVLLGRCEGAPALLVTLGNVTHTPPADVARKEPRCVEKPAPPAPSTGGQGALP